MPLNMLVCHISMHLSSIADALQPNFFRDEYFIIKTNLVMVVCLIFIWSHFFAYNFGSIHGNPSKKKFRKKVCETVTTERSKPRRFKEENAKEKKRERKKKFKIE